MHIIKYMQSYFLVRSTDRVGKKIKKYGQKMQFLFLWKIEIHKKWNIRKNIRNTIGRIQYSFKDIL